MPERPVHERLGWATRFDEAGVDSLWVAEHLALPQEVDHPFSAGWDLLAAMALVTRRCRIGPLVTTFQYHSSLAMARHVVTVDGLSDGRLDLGVGLGGAPVDRAFGGVPDASFGALAAGLDRGLTETSALLAVSGSRSPRSPCSRAGPAPVTSRSARRTPSPDGFRSWSAATARDPSTWPPPTAIVGIPSALGPAPVTSSTRSTGRASSWPSAASPSVGAPTRSPDRSCSTSTRRSRRRPSTS